MIGLVLIARLIAGVFDEAFIDHLFDLVEQTREMTDESFNYSVITLIVSCYYHFSGASMSLTISLGRPQRTVYGRSITYPSSAS